MSNDFNEFFWRLLREMSDNAQSLYVIKVAMHLTQEWKCYNVFLPGKKFLVTEHISFLFLIMIIKRVSQ